MNEGTLEGLGALVKKPAVIWIAQIYLVWFALGSGLVALLSTVGVFSGRLSVAQGGGGLLVGAGALAGAVTVLVKTSRRQITRRWIVLFLWLVLALYPITNILGHVGFYLPASSVADNQLAGAAFTEILRYLIPIALIIWLSFSKNADQYLSAPAGSNNSLQDDARDARA